MRLARVIRYGKYIPVMNFVLMMGHVTALLLGYDAPYAEVLEVTLGFFLVLVYSSAVGFCLMHRIMILYAYLVTACIWFQRYIGFACLTSFRVGVLLVGIVLTILFFLGYGRKRGVPPAARQGEEDDGVQSVRHA